ncbi:MAG: PspC domain-containing protein [Candidatus Thorarchaeota archaeon]
MSEIPTPDYSGGPNGLRRSRNNRMIMGVCGGIAEHYNINSTIVRIVTFLLAFSMIGLLAYIVLGLVIPEE